MGADLNSIDGFTPTITVSTVGLDEHPLYLVHENGGWVSGSADITRHDRRLVPDANAALAHFDATHILLYGEQFALIVPGVDHTSARDIYDSRVRMGAFMAGEFSEMYDAHYQVLWLLTDHYPVVLSGVLRRPVNLWQRAH